MPARELRDRDSGVVTKLGWELRAQVVVQSDYIQLFTDSYGCVVFADCLDDFLGLLIGQYFTGTAGVSPASSNAFSQAMIESFSSDQVAFKESGRDAPGPS